MSPYRFAFTLLLVTACGGKIDPTAIDETATRQVGTAGGSSSGAPSSSSSSGAPTGACTTGLIPFEADFEDGVIGDQFTVNSPSAFSIEWEEPISGSASLRVKPNQASYIARKIPNACAARLEFTLRASDDFLRVGSQIARINAGSRRFSISVGPGGVFLLEEVTGAEASGAGGGAPFGSVFADDPTTFVLDVDLDAKKTTFGFKSPKGASRTRVIDMIDIPLASTPAITSIEIGTTPGIQADPRGLYWIDDIAID
jgi:hypothetical protein